MNMSDDISVIIIDNETSVREHIGEIVNAAPGFKVVGEASNGLDGLNMINEKQADLVILDYFLPQIDGLSLVRQYRSRLHEHDTAFLMLTGYYSDAMAAEAQMLKVECLLQKPITKKCLMERLCIFRNEGQFYATGAVHDPMTELLIEVTRILTDNSFSMSYKGFNMLRDAVIIALTYEGNFSGITKIIYPELAKKYNRTIQSVERNLRSIIGAAWRNRTEHGKYSIMGKVFSRCPTNSEVVFTIADIIKIERAAGEEIRI